ncbi:MAG: hypothetical protein KF833_04945 [Verrucomicrobiae bacterium]|nr:hypothetical protein [Verrucomicrobiae bacterium]
MYRCSLPRSRSLRIAALTACLALTAFDGPASPELPAQAFFGIRAVDDRTGRGIPLVEFETVHRVRFVTDNAGWVAFLEPGLMNRPVFFHVRSHGYDAPKDGFGYASVVLTPRPGERAEVRMRRVNVAERLYRVTGEGLFRDSVLLGEPTPLREPLGTAQVAGQDSAFSVLYRGRIHWFWGDTTRVRHPLGQFWMAGAVSDPPGQGGLAPDVGVDLHYFVNAEGFSRPMARMGVDRGLIWADGFTTVRDASGRERLVCHYAHMESLEKILGHGIAVYDDARETFERIAEFDLRELWRWPAQAHPVRHTDEGVEYLLFGEVFPTSRVPATWEAFIDPDQYQAWTCLASGSTREDPVPDRDASGTLRWGWRRDVPPVDIGLEATLLARGLIRRNEARYHPRDAASDRTVTLHRGSIHWNPHRSRWVAIAVEIGGTTSHLGEVWYAEAPAPTGPWRKAVRIVTHNRYSFYNPVHHPAFDEQEGRRVYFEGTYVNTFSGNPDATPRYDYNQVLYRLDLDDPALVAARE